MTGANQAAVQIVGPLMIGADEPLRRTPGRRANTRTAVPAGIVEGADRPVAAAHDDDRIVADLHGEVVARRRNLAIMAGEQPVAVEDRFEIEAVKPGVGIEFLVEAHAGAPPLQFGEHGVCGAHLSIPRDHHCDRMDQGRRPGCEACAAVSGASPNFPTVAGAAPDFHRLPNSPARTDPTPRLTWGSLHHARRSDNRARYPKVRGPHASMIIPRRLDFGASILVALRDSRAGAKEGVLGLQRAAATFRFLPLSGADRCP